MRIVYDQLKRHRNLEKHRLDFADLNPGFFINAVVMPAHSNRVLAIGPFNETVIAVVFVVLGSEAVSVVSMRPASRKERTVL